MRYLVRYSGFLLVAVLGFGPLPAKAALYFCNKTNMPIEAALGFREDGQFMSQGWWRIEAQQCAKVLAVPLSERFYYYAGRALAAGGARWGGAYVFCTDKKPFRIAGDHDCNARGYDSGAFQQVDVGEEKDFTLNFD